MAEHLIGPGIYLGVFKIVFNVVETKGDENMPP
jgi:hypothetical protein